MKPVYLHGDHILSALGDGSEVNFAQLLAGQSGVRVHSRPDLHARPICASLIDDAEIPDLKESRAGYTRLERLLIHAIQALVNRFDIPLDHKTAVILATTKGNIGLLRNPQALSIDDNRVYLSKLAKQIQGYFNLSHDLVVLSNACISGALALSVARQLLQGSSYERAIVVGGDELSRFILSGFDAFQAMSDEPCRPYDRDRTGINLGEAAVAAYVSTERRAGSIAILGAGSYNDANHISGPSRTGEGLYRSIQAALTEAGVSSVDYISAHGTATPYNDEMEAVALGRCGLTEVPLNSLKGYYGHTLGASGLLESIVGCHCLREGVLLKSVGFEHVGTTVPLNIITENHQAPLETFMKLGSGFGGTNVAMIFRNS